MNVVGKFLLEKNGVPMVINSYVDNIKRYFHAQNYKPFTHTFTFGKKTNFPLRSITIEYKVNIDELLKKPNYNGSYNWGKTVFDNDGFDIFIDVVINSPTENLNDSSLPEIAGVLTHEMTHCFEDYQRRIKTKLNIGAASGSVSASIAADLMGQESIPGTVREFLYLMYSAAAFEVSARTAQVYPLLKGIKDPKERVAKVKESFSWDVANQLTNFNFDEFQEKFTHEMFLYSLEHRVRPVEVFQDIVSQIEKIMDDYNTVHAEETLKNLQLPVEDAGKVEQAVKIVADHASKILHKKPNSFFQYWVKVINRAGEKAKRKLLKMAYNQDF